MLEIHRAQVRSDDHEVHGGDVRHGLELDDDVVHDEVDAVYAHVSTAVPDGHGDLTLDLELALAQLDDERVLVDTFEEPGPERAMYGEGGCEDVTRHRFVIHTPRTLGHCRD